MTLETGYGSEDWIWLRTLETEYGYEDWIWLWRLNMALHTAKNKEWI